MAGMAIVAKTVFISELGHLIGITAEDSGISDGIATVLVIFVAVTLLRVLAHAGKGDAYGVDRVDDPDGFDMYCGPGSVMTDGILDGACLKTLVFDGKSIRSKAFDMNSCITLDKFVFGNDLESIAGDAFDFYNFYDTNGKKIDPTVENLKGHSFVAKNWHEMYMESSGDDALEDDSESLKTPTIALTVLVAAMAFVMIVAFARK